jgi:hypothetical protein
MVLTIRLGLNGPDRGRTLAAQALSAICGNQARPGSWFSQASSPVQA